MEAKWAIQSSAILCSGCGMRLDLFPLLAQEVASLQQHLQGRVLISMLPSLFSGQWPDTRAELRNGKPWAIKEQHSSTGHKTWNQQAFCKTQKKKMNFIFGLFNTAGIIFFFFLNSENNVIKAPFLLFTYILSPHSGVLKWKTKLHHFLFKKHLKDFLKNKNKIKFPSERKLSRIFFRVCQIN